MAQAEEDSAQEAGKGQPGVQGELRGRNYARQRWSFKGGEGKCVNHVGEVR